jgi:hypothetical protein
MLHLGRALAGARFRKFRETHIKFHAAYIMSIEGYSHCLDLAYGKE